MKKQALKIILAVFLALTAISAFTNADQASPLEDRVDAAIIKGKALPAAMLGKFIPKYRLFALQGAELKPIPFQIDEVNDDGLPLVTVGPGKTADSDNGAFDANDELVFMAFDSGPRFSGSPSVSGCDSFLEISLKGPKKGTTGYVYFAHCTAPPPLSTRKYVKWDNSKHLVQTSRYVMGWQEPGFKFYYDYLSIFGGPDLLDRMKVRIAVGFKGFHMVFNEGNFENNRYGHVIGPVRVIDVNLSNLKLGPIGKIPAHQFLIWYQDYIHIHNLLNTSLNPASVGLDYQVRILHDLKINRARGYKLCASVVPSCIIITGKMTPEMKEIAKRELEWGGVVGPEGAFITQLVMDDKLHTRSMGFYLDDDNAKRRPEYIPGSGPEMGFYVVDWKKAEKGVGYLDFYHFIMKKYSIPEVLRYMRITKLPLKITVTAK